MAREPTQPLATLAATDTWLGNSGTLTLLSPPGNPFFVVVGVPSDPAPWLADTLYLDLNASVTLAFGAQSTTGSSTFAVVVPNDPALRGRMVGFQAASFAPAAIRLTLTNPTLRVLE